MGLDIKRFRETEIKEEFICPICCDILEDPVLIELCEHVFCRKCIEEWLSKSEQKCCPIDREEFNEKSLRPPQRSFRNLITNLLISCDFASNGCQQYVRIDELSVHSTNCPFNPVVMNQDIDCPSDCGAIVKRCMSIDEHNCVSYLKTIIEKNNEIIQKLSQQNKELLTENVFLKKECEDVCKQIQVLCRENDEFSTELSNVNQKLLSKSEIIQELNAINVTKDKSISDLILQIRNLKIENQKLLDLTKDTKSDVSLGDESTDSRLQQTTNLISFDALDNCHHLDDSNAETIQSSDVLSIETSTENRNLVQTLCKRGYLKNPRVIRAMLSIDRGLFAPSAASYALQHIRSIGHGAHTGPASYEATLLQFLELNITNNCKVLDIGSGTGYLTSCIAKLIEPNGRVIGIEHIPQLVQQSIQTIEKYYPELRESEVLKIYVSDGRFGCAAEAPFDLIFIEPLTRRLPQKLIDQLRPGGSIIVPIGARDKDINLELFTKQTSGDLVRQVLCDDWKLMQENTLDLLEDKKLQLRSGWKVKLGF